MRRITHSLSAAGVALTLGARVGAQSRTLDVDSARINYTLTGSGPAVVLIHGWALNLREWTDQIPALSSRYTVIALDRRGFGKSTGIADETADPGDIRALLDSLHVQSATLVGHSAGAAVAMRFAAAMPDRVDALVLYGGPPPAGFPGEFVPPPGPSPVARIARASGVDSALRTFASRPQFRPGPRRTPQVAARLDSIVKSYSGRDLLEDRAASNRFGPATVSTVRDWRFPILYISGEWEMPAWHRMADTVASWLPNVRHVVIPGGGHGVHLDEPQAFNAALLEFLNSTHRTVPAKPRAARFTSQ
jgi:pimeloyl-ACP methyl ester carboxylesterase